MTTSDELIALEKRGWAALATSGEAAADFYRQVLDDDIAMVLPGGMTILTAMPSLRPWAASPGHRST
jgi:hypothetical protein